MSLKPSLAGFFCYELLLMGRRNVRGGMRYDDALVS